MEDLTLFRLQLSKVPLQIETSSKSLYTGTINEIRPDTIEIMDGDNLHLIERSSIVAINLTIKPNEPNNQMDTQKT